MKLSTLLAVLPLAAASPIEQRSEPAPLLVPRGATAESLIPDNYIVKFKEGSALSILEDAMKLLPAGHGVEKIQSIFKGFSGKLNAATLKLIRNHPDVEYVEQNQMFRTDGYVTQNNAAWGLARISHNNPGYNNYIYDDSAGSGTCAYVVDSGIDVNHVEFGGRATMVASYIGNNADTCGHGTHVAGTIGGTTYGVAKKTSLYGIKVLAYNANTGRCEGPNDGIIRGLEYVATDAARRNCPKGVVVNMSLGGDYSQASNDAVAALVRKGFFVAVAAGNGDINQNPIDTRYVSPASEPLACTVAASDSSDRIASFSNYGSAVDIIGPGVGVVSARTGGGTVSMSGTSMATPHVAGLGAYMLSFGVGTNGLCQYLQKGALSNRISGVRSGTKNLLAQNGAYA